MHTTLKFQSITSVFLTYLILKSAPIPAVVYYFFGWQASALSAVFLLLIILLYSGSTNHHFTLARDFISIHPSLFFWKADISIAYANIQSVEIKFAAPKDNRQWLLLHYKDATGRLLSQKYRCDWLHTQEPEGEEDDHEHPEGELFELLEDEDFYDGSLEQLMAELRNREILVEGLFYGA